MVNARRNWSCTKSLSHQIPPRNALHRREATRRLPTGGAPDRSGAQRLVTALRRAAVALDAGSRAAQARLAISRTQLAAMELLSAGSPLLVGHISRELGISTGTASEMLEQLVKQGLVARVDDPADRRRTLVSITPAGRRQFRRAFKERWAWVHTMASALSPRDRALVSGFLERLPDAMPRDWRAVAQAPPPEIHVIQPAPRRRRAGLSRTASRPRQSSAIGAAN